MSEYRAIRSGNWEDADTADLAARARRAMVPSWRNGYLRFRCALTGDGGTYRVNRGGSANYGATGYRTTYRFGNNPGYSGNGIGLRCVRREV